jgi:hypothetical protein
MIQVDPSGSKSLQRQPKCNVKKAPESLLVKQADRYEGHFHFDVVITRWSYRDIGLFSPTSQHPVPVIARREILTRMLPGRRLDSSEWYVWGSPDPESVRTPCNREPTDRKERFRSDADCSARPSTMRLLVEQFY